MGVKAAERGNRSTAFREAKLDLYMEAFEMLAHQIFTDWRVSGRNGLGLTRKKQ